MKMQITFHCLHYSEHCTCAGYGVLARLAGRSNRKRYRAYLRLRFRSQFQLRRIPWPTVVVLPRLLNLTGCRSALSLKQAEALALSNNPQISVARLTALASHQVTREVRSNLWPTATGNLTAVDSQTNSRITAGGLNNPIIYERAAAGVIVSQLITDFGRTTNLISSANLAAKAQDQNCCSYQRANSSGSGSGLLQCTAGSMQC